MLHISLGHFSNFSIAKSFAVFDYINILVAKIHLRFDKACHWNVHNNWILKALSGKTPTQYFIPNQQFTVRKLVAELYIFRNWKECENHISLKLKSLN